MSDGGEKQPYGRSTAQRLPARLWIARTLLSRSPHRTTRKRGRKRADRAVTLIWPGCGSDGSARTTMSASGFGLFDPALEKDSCGVGFIADIKGAQVAQDRRRRADDPPSISNIAVRSAPIRAPATAPAFWCRRRTSFSPRRRRKLGFTLPPPGHYARRRAVHAARCRVAAGDHGHLRRRSLRSEGMTLLGWRDVPTDNSTLGESVKPTEPVHMQVFIGRDPKINDRRRVRAPALHPAQDHLRHASTRARARGIRTITRCRSPAAR